MEGQTDKGLDRHRHIGLISNHFSVLTLIISKETVDYLVSLYLDEVKYITLFVSRRAMSLIVSTWAHCCLDVYSLVAIG